MTLYRETPCEHGNHPGWPHCHKGHPRCGMDGTFCDTWCPGGPREEVTIDYEAAARLGVVWASFTEKEKARRIAYVKPFIDTALAALRVTEDVR